MLLILVLKEIDKKWGSRKIIVFFFLSVMLIMRRYGIYFILIRLRVVSGDFFSGVLFLDFVVVKDLGGVVDLVLVIVCLIYV